MYKLFETIPEEFTLVLKLNNKNIVLEFEEPTISNYEKIIKLINKWNFSKVLEILKIEIDKNIFNNHYEKIISWIVSLLYKNVESRKNDIFMPSIFEKLWNKYHVLPSLIPQLLTPSQLNYILVWIEFNSNEESDKNFLNHKYKDEEAILEELHQYDDALERVRLAKIKLWMES